MNRLYRALVAIAAVSAASNGLAQTERSEIGYERGALGFEALMANDNERALRQLLSERSIPRSDPARLINLGRAYARLGDVAKARESFEAAVNCKDDFDLVLSDGSIMNSRKAAKIAIRDLDKR
jgi:Tfp pilus assembly protein PilF